MKIEKRFGNKVLVLCTAAMSKFQSTQGASHHLTLKNTIQHKIILLRIYLQFFIMFEFV